MKNEIEREIDFIRSKYLLPIEGVQDVLRLALTSIAKQTAEAIKEKVNDLDARWPNDNPDKELYRTGWTCAVNVITQFIKELE